MTAAPDHDPIDLAEWRFASCLNREDLGPVHAGGLESFRPHVMAEQWRADAVQAKANFSASTAS
jgi:hypothetical protein